MKRFISGADFEDFYKNHWPKGYYHEDCEIEVESEQGVLLVKPTDKLDLKKLGWLVNDAGHSITFEAAYNDFASNVKPDKIYVIKVPEEKIEAFEEQIKALGLSLGDQEPDETPSVS